MWYFTLQSTFIFIKIFCPIFTSGAKLYWSLCSILMLYSSLLFVAQGRTDCFTDITEEIIIMTFILIAPLLNALNYLTHLWTLTRIRTKDSNCLEQDSYFTMSVCVCVCADVSNREGVKNRFVSLLSNDSVLLVNFHFLSKLCEQHLCWRQKWCSHFPDWQWNSSPESVVETNWNLTWICF